MSRKLCKDQPICARSSNASSKTKMSPRKRQKMIIHGFIRLSLREYLVPQDVVNIIYAFVTFRNYITIAMVGDVDAGKSTLAGRILHRLRVISDNELHKTRQYARELGKESFQYAFLMDKLREEQARGLTIIGSARHQFKIGTYTYALIDVPGSRYYLKTTIKYLSMADAAILVIPINKGSFECSVAKGNHKKGELTGATVIHARLCLALGVEQLIVAFNKMDLLQRDYYVGGCHQRFIECKAKVTKILNKIGYKTKKIAFVPISAWLGENIWCVCTDKPYLKWHQGFNVKQKKRSYVQGFTLFDALRDVIRPNNRFFMLGLNKQFKMSICNVYKIRGVGDVVTGRVICGRISCSELNKKNNTLQLNVYPYSLTKKGLELKSEWSLGSIQHNYRDVDTAECGDMVSLNLKGLTYQQRRVLRNKSLRGLLSLDTSDSTSKPQLVDTFTALVFVVRHPSRLRAARQQIHRMKPWEKDGKKGTYYVGGYTVPVFVSTWRAPCKMIEINWCHKRSESEHKLDHPMFIEQGDFAEVIFKALQPFVLYRYHDIRAYGRMVVIDSHQLVLIGKVISFQHQ
eukprot:566023_1